MPIESAYHHMKQEQDMTLEQSTEGAAAPRDDAWLEEAVSLTHKALGFAYAQGRADEESSKSSEAYEWQEKAKAAEYALYDHLRARPAAPAQDVREVALEEAAKAIEAWSLGHAKQAGEEIGDPECDFETAWADAAKIVRARKMMLDNPPVNSTTG